MKSSQGAHAQDYRLTLKSKLRQQLDWGIETQQSQQLSQQYDSSEENEQEQQYAINNNINNQHYSDNINNNNYQSTQFNIQPSSTTSSSRLNGSKHHQKDIAREFQRLHQKMINNKTKRHQQQNIAVPQNRDALLLKYGHLPGKHQQQTSKRFEGEVASYKIDAMRLIINRIYRYLGNVFDEIQRKVMRDDIMRQRKEIYELMKPYKQKHKNQYSQNTNTNNNNMNHNSDQLQQQQQQQQNFNDENNCNMVNQRNELMSIMNMQKDNNSDNKSNNKFREMFELKRKRIKDSLHEYEMSQSESQIQLDNNIIYMNSQDSLFQQVQQNSIYETPGKDEILYIEKYIQPRQDVQVYDDDNHNNTEIDNQILTTRQQQKGFQPVQFQEYNNIMIDSGNKQRIQGNRDSESGRKQIQFNNRYNSDDEDIEEEKVNDSQRLFHDQDQNNNSNNSSLYMKDGYQTTRQHASDSGSNKATQKYEIIHEQAIESSPSQNNDTQTHINYIEQQQEIFSQYYEQSQQNQAIILPAIKKQQASYLQLDNLSKNKQQSKQQLVNQTLQHDQNFKQSDLIEMSFSENPFVRKGSLDVENHNHNHDNSSYNSCRQTTSLREEIVDAPSHNSSTTTGCGQHSPDFKRNINTNGMNSQQSLFNKNALTSQNQMPSNISNHINVIKLTDSIETFNGDQLQLQENKKPKLKDQLLEIMSQFDTNNQQYQSTQKDKNILCDDTLQQQSMNEDVSEVVDSSLQQIDLNQQLQIQVQSNINGCQAINITSPLQQQQQQKQNQNTSKLNELKKRLGLSSSNSPNKPIKQNDVIQLQTLSPNNNTLNQNENLLAINKSNTDEDNHQQNKFQDSPLGKMLKLSENEILFEEKRVSPIKIDEAQQILLQKVKRRQQALNSQLDEIKKLQEAENTEHKKGQYLNQTESLVYILQNFQLQQKKAGFMNLIRNQIEYSKLLHLRKLKTKMLKKMYFKQFKNSCKNVKLLETLKSLIVNKVKTNNQIQQEKFQVWVNKVQIIILNDQKQRNDKYSKSYVRLQNLMKQKQLALVKYSYEIIKQRNIEKLQEQFKQSKSKSITLIQNILLKKQKKLLNKKFQKFRKVAFLLSFDKKLMNLTNLLDRQVTINKKDTFKEIINFCIRSDPYKKQVEFLNSEFMQQRNQIVYSQLNRMTKLLNKSILKSGFSQLNMFVNDKKVRDSKLKCMIKIFSKYQIQQDKQLVAQQFKLWIKSIQSQKLQSQLRKQSLKKIRLLLSVSIQRQLQQKFDLWKSETQNYLKYELTKYTQEQTILRNNKLEQLLIDRLWCQLSFAFNSIKNQAKIKKCLEYLVKKHENKSIKIMRQSALNKWRNKVFKIKIVKVNLTVLLKNLERKQMSKAQTYIKKWKRVIEKNKMQKFKLSRVLQMNIDKEIKNIKKLQKQAIIKFKERVQVCKIFKQIFGQILRNRQTKKVNKSFQKWKDIFQNFTYLKQQAQVVLSIRNRILLRQYFQKFNKKLHIKQRKLASITKIESFIYHFQLQRKLQSLLEIQQHSNTLKLKQSNFTEALKIINRLKKSIDYKTKQRYVIKWKLNTLDSRQHFEKYAIQQQYLRKLMLNIFGKQKSVLQSIGLNAFKTNVKIYKEQQRLIQQRQKGLQCLVEQLERTQMSNMRSAFLNILMHSNEVQQNYQVNKAISKLSSVSRICEYLNKSRRDREYFFRWKNQALRIQAYEFGFQVLDFQFKKCLKNHFEYLNSQSQSIQILKTRQKIGLNMLKMILYKTYKDQIQKSFSIWLIQSQQPVTTNRFEKQRKSHQPPLPPRTQINIIENSCKKKKVELLFTLLPIQQNNQVPKRLFSNHHSKSNSGNNSVTSQKNLRYSQQDEEEEDQYYDYEKLNLDTNQELNNSSEQLNVIKPKMSFGSMAMASLGSGNGGSKRDSKQGNRSVSNTTKRNRYDNTQDNHDYDDDNYDNEGSQSQVNNSNSYCEGFKIAPLLTQKNQSLKKSLFLFLQDEQKIQQQQQQQQVQDDEVEQDDFNIYGIQKVDASKQKVSVSPLKKRKSNVKKSKPLKSEQSSSRNSKVGSSNQNLNKYLSTNSQSNQQQTNSSQKRTSSVRGSQQKVKNRQSIDRQQPNTSIIIVTNQNPQAINIIPNTTISDKIPQQKVEQKTNLQQYKLELLSDDESSHQPIVNPIKQNNEQEETLQQLLLKNQSQSRLLSPRELEPVPEVIEENNNIVTTKNSTQKQSGSFSRPRRSGAIYSANTNLSNFLNKNTNSTRSASRPQQEKKAAKQKSKENNEKFRVFLNKSSNRNSQSNSNLNSSQTHQQSSQSISQNSSIVNNQKQQQQHQVNNYQQDQYQQKQGGLTHQQSSLICSSNPLSYTTSIDRLQLISANPSSQTLINQIVENSYVLSRLNQVNQGLNKLNNYLMKKYMIKVAEYAYSPEQDQYYKHRILMKIKSKIQRLIEIKEGLRDKPDYMKQEAFLIWKRMDYLIMLESLNMFRNNISQFYSQN